jgi:HAE1 family hydrophobic/amphiphilic exporter-1
VAGLAGTAHAGQAQGLPPAGSITKQAIQATAQAPQSQARVLTLDEALKIAAAKNYDIEKAREFVNWVEGKYREELAIALPHATATFNVGRSYDDSQRQLFNSFAPGGGTSSSSTSISDIFGARQDLRVAQLNIEQLVFTWGSVGAALRAAKKGFDQADAQLARFQQTVARDVTTAFYDVLIAREFENIAREALDQKQRHLDETLKRKSAGTATDFDVLAAQVTVDNARPVVIRTANDVRVARDRLAWLLAETADLDVTGSLEATPGPVPGYDEVLAKALQNRPELGELDSQKAINDELLKIAKAGNKPTVSFAATLGYRSIGLPTLSSSGRTWSAGLFAALPIFDGYRTKGQVIQAQSNLSTVTIEATRVRNAIALEVRTALNAVAEAAEILAGTAGTVKQAEQLLALAEKGFELGVKTRLDVQDAQTNVSQARANLARAQRDYRVARVNLEWVAGTVGTWPK